MIIDDEQEEKIASLRGDIVSAEQTIEMVRRMTQGPCDQCWGSGSIDETWPNVKALEDEVRDLRAERARIAAELRSQIDRMRNSDYTEDVTARACGDLDVLACIVEVTS